MPLKSIAVFLDTSSSSEVRLLYAVELAIQHKAHVVGVFTVPARQDPLYTRGGPAIRDTIVRQRVEEEEIITAAKARFKRTAELVSVNFELRVVRQHDVDQQALRNSLHVDLVIVGGPASSGLPEGWSTEALLFASGVPHLIVPEQWEEPRQFTTGANIVVGWNASREARRAISDALPLLANAKSVSVVVVDAQANESHGEEPGADIALFLARHGINVTVIQLQSNGAPVGSVILEEAQRVEADMLVLGAYSHNRTIEALFGGVTRHLLENIRIPLFVAH